MQVFLSSSPNTHATYVVIYPCVSVTLFRCRRSRSRSLTWMSKRMVQQIVDVPVPQIPEQIVEVVFEGLWFACKGTSDSTGGRAHNPRSRMLT